MLVESIYMIAAIAAAGAVGAILRFLVSLLFYELLGRGFPYGTLFVNVIGCFMIGYLFVWFLDKSIVSDAWRMAILVGLLGSFTTFSTFSLETYNLVTSGLYLRAAINVFASVILCLLGTWIGVSIARTV